MPLNSNQMSNRQLRRKMAQYKYVHLFFLLIRTHIYTAYIYHLDSVAETDSLEHLFYILTGPLILNY